MGTMSPVSGTSGGRSVSLRFLLEEDAAHRSVYGRAKDTPGRALFSAIVTLTLGVLGSTILPVPFAISRTGVLPGVVTMLLVAYVNDCTCCYLVRAAAATGRTGYEQLAEWAGGRKARVLTQVSLILLLYGTLCGGLAFLADVARMMVLKGIPADAPQQQHSPPPTLGLLGVTEAAASALPPFVERWVEGLREWFAHTALPVMRQDGRPLMLVVVATILYPLCLQKHIRQFERAATVGVVVVVVLMAIVVGNAVRLGFPAVAAGELPVWGFHSGGHEALPEAFAVLGFAFYMQPMLMPLLAEMPSGETGRAVSERAVHIVLFGVACAAYGTVGVFGAATYGDRTESNIMVNDLLAGQPVATLWLYGALLVYLCCGMVTTHYALRASLQVLIMPHPASSSTAPLGGAGDAPAHETGAPAPLRAGPRVLLTTCILLMALAVAVTFPTQAERIFALTGCTAVCLVCYIIPVFIHLVLQHRMHHHQHQHLTALAAHRSSAAAERGASAGTGRSSVGQPPSGRGAASNGEWERGSESSGPELMLIPPVSPGGDVASVGSRLVTPTHQAAGAGALLHPACTAPVPPPAGAAAAAGGGSLSRGSGDPPGRHASDAVAAWQRYLAQQHQQGHQHPPCPVAEGGAGLRTPLLQAQHAHQPHVATAEPPPLSHWHYDSAGALLALGSRPGRRSCAQLVALLALPTLIISVGVGFSLAGLYVGAMDVWHSLHDGGDA